MANPNARVSEYEVSVAVLRVLAETDKGAAPIAYLVKNCPKFLDLSPADLATSKTRPNEGLWEQLVRNITSHHDAEGNFIHDGYLERVDGGLKITDAGRTFLKAKG